MSALHERSVAIAGGACRIWEKGAGAPLGWLSGLGGAPRWPAACESLSESRRVIVPSLPGFPGADDQHHRLDGHLDWLATTLDLLEEAGLAGADLVASSVAAMLAADVAAFAPGFVRRLVLIAPLGLYDAREPVADVFATTPLEAIALQSTQPERFRAVFEAPAAAGDPAEWQILLYRAAEAAARIAWPFGERGLAKRLHRIRVPVLLLWGEHDRVVPASYAKRFAQGLAGATETRVIPGAGHQVAIDAPEETAAAIAEFLAA